MKSEHMNILDIINVDGKHIMEVDVFSSFEGACNTY
jgi:hypothetical protein